MAQIDFVQLTADETFTLAAEVLQHLTQEQLFLLLNHTLTAVQKEKLSEAWRDAIREPS